MKIRNILIAVVTIIVVAIAWKTSEDKAPTREIAHSALYPGLVDRVNDVQSIVIRSANDTTQLSHRGDAWVVANRDDFPATVSTIKQMLLNLAAARIIEKKTSKPDRYAAIGVTDVDAAESRAKLVELAQADGTTIASLLIGNEREGGQLAARQFYVRRAGEETALLVEGELNVADDPTDWMETDVVDIATERVAEVRIERDDATPVVISKAKKGDNFFELQAVPAGFVAKSRALVSSLGAVLLDVKFDDVAAAAKVENLEPRSRAVVSTFDGLRAEIEQFDIDGRIFSRLSFAYDESLVATDETDGGGSAPPTDDAGADAAGDAAAEKSVPAQVAELNARVADWVYAFPDYKNRMLDKTFDDMIKAEEPPADGEAKAE